MMENNYASLLIREIRKEELAFAAECTAAECWVSENYNTLEGFYLNDPKSCLLAEENGLPMGICIATFYCKSGFIGELIVRPEARGRGVGTELLSQGVRVLKERGVETIYLDGVIKAVELYERNGFHKVCRSWRFSGNLAGKPSSNVRRMMPGDLDRVCALDRLAFGADRSFFLGRRLEIFPGLCQVMLDGDRLTGFILGREGEDWVSAGPWVVDGKAENPVELLKAFALEAHGRPINIGVLATNLQACDLMRTLGFRVRKDSPWRMALGSLGDLGASHNCFAVGSAAKG